VLLGLAAVALGACTDDAPAAFETTTFDGTVPQGTSFDAPSAASSDDVQPEGFSTITARITETDGDVCEVCVWLADSSDERARGLMWVTDLGDAVGMVFRHDEPVTERFYMLNTPTPLSIAWFSPDGRYAVSTDMEPCLEVPEGGCPLYGPGVDYELALEVFEGGLDELGIGPGARLELVAGTEGDTCALASASAATP